MIYVDLDKIEEEVPGEWRARARNALDELRAIMPDDRAQWIRQHPLWRDLINILRNHRHGKCWYCETNDIRSDNAIDHFRPAGGVKEDSTHHGYWWLSYEPRNYRYSCTYCNERRNDKEGGTSGGKWFHFPLINPDSRACAEGDNINNEYPLLLDPAEVEDCDLLWFRPDGLPEPKHSEATDSVCFRRAKESIYFYHLDHKSLRERRRKLFFHIKRLIEDGDLHAGDCERRHDLKKTLKTLRELIDERAPYSATSYAYLSLYKGKPWLRPLFREARS